MQHSTRTSDHHRHAFATSAVFAIALTAFNTASFAQSVSAQWRGANRDGVYTETGLLERWPEGGPRLLKTITGLGTGHSSPAVTSTRIYVTSKDKAKTGHLHAFDREGTLVWKTAYGTEWSGSYPGVRATPTVAGNRIYLVSGTGTVVCFDAGSGKTVWSVDMAKHYGAPLPKWGFNESVLLDQGRLYCTPGSPAAAIAALDPATGKELWRTPGDKETSGYCSPMIALHNGRRLLITMLSGSIRGFDAQTGAQLWSVPHPTSYGVHANTPHYIDGMIVYTSGYGEGAAALKLSQDGNAVTKVWSNPEFDVQIGGSIILGDRLFGSGHRRPSWHALNIANGEIVYSTKEFDRGSVVAADGILYCYSENGHVHLVKPHADRFEVLGSVPISAGSGQHWPHPVLADKRMYVRRGDALMIYGIGR